MDAMKSPARPPRSGSASHWARWLEKYAGGYANHDERRDAYRDFLTNLATMQAVFSQPDSMHVAGYLAAHERVAAGDADHLNDGELWAPANLQGDDLNSWLEGFRARISSRTPRRQSPALPARGAASRWELETGSAALTLFHG